MRVFIIEDDRALLMALEYRLRKEGIETASCTDGQSGLEALREPDASYDALILDRMLPGIDGVTLLERLRTFDHSLPVLMLTAMDSVRDRVTGLDAGADDYLVKPFAMDELLARLRALDRRKTPWTPHNVVTAGDLTLDGDQCLLKREDKAASLSKTEAKLLAMLMRNVGQTLPRGVLIDRVWGGADVEDGNLDTQIHYLRKHLKTVRTHSEIRTVRGIGYRLECKHA